MKFTEVKEKELRNKVILILLDCIREAVVNNEEEYASDWYFMEKVFYAGLVTTTKEYFLLGKIAEEVHSVGPKALEESMKLMGVIKDDSKEAKAMAYWTEKYGEEEAQILSHKLISAFLQEKYSLEDIKRMGDKIEIFRGNNKINI